MIACGCKNTNDKCNDLFGLAYNQKRIELDIPIIEPDWIIHDCDTNLFTGAIVRIELFQKSLHIHGRGYI
ncbi:MAG: hypothetical protein ACJAZV_000060 [Roseivirga sp.]|jgi:hypothetical protein